MQIVSDSPAAANDFYPTGILAGARCGNCANWCRATPKAKLGQCGHLPAGARYFRFDVLCCVNNGNAFKGVR